MAEHLPKYCPYQVLVQGREDKRKLLDTFREQPNADQYTFFDLAHLLGFEQITFTDGETFAHRIELRAAPAR